MKKNVVIGAVNIAALAIGLSIVSRTFIVKQSVVTTGEEDRLGADKILATTTADSELQKSGLIRLGTPRSGQTVSSPLSIKGEARGSWFFEASFPVFLVDWDGRIIAQGVAQAKDDWMTEDFVPFEAKLIFTVDENIYSRRGALILRKDNASGLPEHDDALEIPIVLQ